MLPRVQFYPDIETKFDHLIAHMNDKNKLTSDLVNILKQVANLQQFYSNTLDKFANAISKLFAGKDPIKDILIILDRLITSKSDGSSKLAKQIKDDLIPHLEKSIDASSQQMLRDKQNHVRNIRASMQRKLKMLLASEANFKRAVQQINSLPKLVQMGEKEKALQAYRKKEDQFSDTIDSYNASLDEYMLKYTQICQQLSTLETNRKSHFRDSIGNLIIFQMVYIKGLEYNFAKYAEQLKKMQGKLMIQDKILGGAEQFYQSKQGGIVHLAKISNKNYIDNIMGKKKVNQNILGQQVQISQLKSKHPVGQVPKQQYHKLVKQLMKILNFVHTNNHTNLLIQVVLFAKGIVTTSKGTFKISLLNSLLLHQLFSDPKFWNAYEKRLLQKINRQQHVKSGDEQTLQNNFSHVLDRDLTMLQNVQINSFVSKVIVNICERVKFQIIKPPLQNNTFQREQPKPGSIPFKYKFHN